MWQCECTYTIYFYLTECAVYIYHVLFTLLQDTQQAVTRTSKQLRRIQNEGTNVEKRLQQAEEDLKIMTKELERERCEHKELSEQVSCSLPNTNLTAWNVANVQHTERLWLLQGYVYHDYCKQKWCNTPPFVSLLRSHPDRTLKLMCTVRSFFQHTNLKEIC